MLPEGRGPRSRAACRGRTATASSPPRPPGCRNWSESLGHRGCGSPGASSTLFCPDILGYKLRKQTVSRPCGSACESRTSLFGGNLSHTSGICTEDLLCVFWNVCSVHFCHGNFSHTFHIEKAFLLKDSTVKIHLICIKLRKLYLNATGDESCTSRDA